MACFKQLKLVVDIRRAVVSAVKALIISR